MPLFLSDEELEAYSQDGALVAEKADAFIAQVYKQLDNVRAQADAASITAEQTCSLLEQKYVSLSSEFSNVQSQLSQVNSSLDQRLSELAQLQSDKHQLHLQSIVKDGEIERLSTEASELHKSKRQLMELLSHKDLTITEKNATIQSYLDKIVKLTDTAASREARLSDTEAESARSHASCARLAQEKELIENHNIWLNDELTSKVNSLLELHKTHTEREADMSAKLEDVERNLNESSSSLKWNKDRVRELELKISSLQEELCSSKGEAAANEVRLSAENSTVTKLVELYKESSEEWSKKAVELEGVVKALETHLSNVENDYKERLENEVSARKEIEKEAACFKERLEKCEAELETSRKTVELNPHLLSSFSAETWMDSATTNNMVEDNLMLVPNIPVGVSGTALAASLLRDGWSLAKMYAKYQEAVDALRHEQLGRKQSQAILERVLYEIEQKAAVILDERAEHERLVEAYSVVNQKLQHFLSEQSTLDKTIHELKADSRRHERDYAVAQKEIVDLQKQVTVLLKECRDIQLRCGSSSLDYADNGMTTSVVMLNAESDAEKVISERLLTFKDINGLVEQNVQLRSLVRSLWCQIENKEMELKENFEKELQKHTDEAASKVNAVLARAEEQGCMIESLHASVAMYKKLYEEKHRRHSSSHLPQEALPEERRKDIMLLLEDSQEATRKAQEQALQRVKCLEEEVEKARSDIISLRSERDKLTLEVNFAQEKLGRFLKEYDHQRNETNGVIARNVEFSQLIIDYQRKLREGSESLHASEEFSRKLTMEVSVLKHEKELLLNSEKRACDEVRTLSERVHRLQASLDTIQSADEVREEARGIERRKQEEYIKQIEREWAEAKKELEEERDNVRTLTLERGDTMKNAMRQVEEIGKELTNTLHAVAAAEARAAVAEACCSDLEKKIKFSEIKVSEKDGECGPSSNLLDQIVVDLRTAKDEIERLREDAQVNKDHMLQYKSIAQVNETALKEMEAAHENFKIEADKVKKSLESELLLLREQVTQLESECSMKTKEAASAAAGQEEDLSSALSEISCLKEDNSVKMSQIGMMEMQISALKDDLDKEHQRWRTSQANYERQVILQSETIQELTKTSQSLALLQEEASDLRKSAEVLKIQNNDLKAKFEAEKSMLEEAKIKAERNYNEINEQNKILHSRLEAFHIKLAEKDRGSSGASSGITGKDSPDDAGLQNVVNYLRRSKEIAETEISLLKQQKLRLQSQLENGLKAAETAQASLHTERASSRAMLFTEGEFKSLQLQVREMNLLRESNIQLREENKHNFEECQKLLEASLKYGSETENLETLLKDTQNEMESCRKEIEMQKMERGHLERRIDELLERCKNIDVEDYERVREDAQQMQAKLKENDVQLEDLKKIVSEKQAVISELEHDLAGFRIELKERETKINEILQVEASLKSDVEKQKKLIVQLKKKSENLSMEKEELSKENQALSKQLDDTRQAGKRSIGDAVSEQAMKEKEKEKDTRIQILEKTVERQREELRKEKEEHKSEKARRLRTQKTITDSYETVKQEKSKLLAELEKHKQALETLTDEVEKLKHAKSNQPESASVVQLLSGTPLENLSAAYLLAVENFEQVAQPLITEFGATTAHTSAVDTPSLRTSQATPAPTPPMMSPVAPSSGFPSSNSVEEIEKKFNFPKTNVETRRTGRKLVRPRIVKPEEPQGDVEMTETEGFNNTGKPLLSHNIEIQGNLPIPTQSSVRKRPSPSTSELHEESLVQQDTGSDVAVPVLKRSKGLDSQQKAAEGHSAANLETPEILSATEEYLDDTEDLEQGFNEEAIYAEKDVLESYGERSEEPKIDCKNEVELHDGKSDVGDDSDKPTSETVVSDDRSSGQAEQAGQQLTTEFGSDREEGELLPDGSDFEGGSDTPNIFGGQEVGEVQPAEHVDVVPHVSSPGAGGVDEVVPPATDMGGEVNSPPQALDDEKNDEGDMIEELAEEGQDKFDDGNDHLQVVAVETDQVPDAALSSGEGAASTSAAAAVEVGVPPSQGSTPTSSVASVTEEVKQVSTAKTSTTINLQERARQRAMLRQAGVLPSPSLGRGRGRTPRGRGGRSGRGQRTGEQS